ncbi:MAG TPA: hypothetical protein VFG47_00630 [Geminicoccaceae bacterium]|nr:hypothetical protein [Geminicoccaceae bacterium]
MTARRPLAVCACLLPAGPGCAVASVVDTAVGVTATAVGTAAHVAGTAVSTMASVATAPVRDDDH